MEARGEADLPTPAAMPDARLVCTDALLNGSTACKHATLIINLKGDRVDHRGAQASGEAPIVTPCWLAAMAANLLHEVPSAASNIAPSCSVKLLLPEETLSACCHVAVPPVAQLRAQRS